MLVRGRGRFFLERCSRLGLGFFSSSPCFSLMMGGLGGMVGGPSCTSGEDRKGAERGSLLYPAPFLWLCCNLLLSSHKKIRNNLGNVSRPQCPFVVRYLCFDRSVKNLREKSWKKKVSVWKKARFDD